MNRREFIPAAAAALASCSLPSIGTTSSAPAKSSPGRFADNGNVWEWYTMNPHRKPPRKLPFSSDFQIILHSRIDDADGRAVLEHITAARFPRGFHLLTCEFAPDVFSAYHDGKIVLKDNVSHRRSSTVFNDQGKKILWNGIRWFEDDETWDDVLKNLNRKGTHPRLVRRYIGPVRLMDR